MLSRFGRFVLGLYPPFSPEDLRLTDVEPPRDDGLSSIISKVGMSDADRARQQAYQQQQHATRNQLQESEFARESAEHTP